MSPNLLPKFNDAFPSRSKLPRVPWLAHRIEVVRGTTSFFPVCCSWLRMGEPRGQRSRVASFSSITDQLSTVLGFGPVVKTTVSAVHWIRALRFCLEDVWWDRRWLKRPVLSHMLDCADARTGRYGFLDLDSVIFFLFSFQFHLSCPQQAEGAISLPYS